MPDDDEPDDTLLYEASVDELLKELGSRCAHLLVVGVRTNIDPDGDTAPGKNATMTFTKGGLHAALGLATAVRRLLLKKTDINLDD